MMDFVIRMTVIYICFSFLQAQKPNRYHGDVYNQCVNIKEQICHGLQYTQTKMPNLANIANQEDSAKRLHDYFPLINADCSQYFRFFLCTVYFPMCSEALGSPDILLPCNTLCVYIQSRCEPYLRAFQLPWPAELNCNRFPENSTMCIQPKNYYLDQNKRQLDPTEIDQFKRSHPDWNMVIHTTLNDGKQLTGTKENNEMGQSSTRCRSPFAQLPFRGSEQMNASLCVLRCDANLLYNSSDKHLAKVWLLVWAVSCLISSIVAIAAFLFDRKQRFKYPERPIVFIVICYGCVCFFHLIQLSLGKKKMICQPLPLDSQEFVTVNEGGEGPLCTLMFLGTYYFEMVAAVWWLMLALSCYLASARKWSSEALEKVSNVMHTVSWMAPALKATIILIIHKIDTDELLGMCYVGRQSSRSNLVFVLVPRIVYFSVGVILLWWSFKSLLLLRKNLTQPELKLFLDGLQNQQSLDKFIVKTGIFCGVYGIPMICYISCQLYYYLNTDKWNTIAEILAEKNPRCLSRSGLRWSDPSCTNIISLPLIEIRLLELFSSLVIGITSAMWMWCNKKTFVVFSEVVTSKLLCHWNSKPKSRIDVTMKIISAQQCCYKNVNSTFSSDINRNQYPLLSFDQSQSHHPTSVTNDSVCYNPNVIMCNV